MLPGQSAFAGGDPGAISLRLPLAAQPERVEMTQTYRAEPDDEAAASVRAPG